LWNKDFLFNITGVNIVSARTAVTPNRCTLRRELVKKVCQKLARSYPKSRLGNKKNPLDEYLYITLSLRTHEKGLKAAYGAFKERFPSWEMAHKASKKEIREAIVRGGLAKQKAANIKMALTQIHDRFGKVSLRGLRRMDRNEAEAFLLTLPGVGL
jgi:endonuclease III